LRQNAQITLNQLFLNVWRNSSDVVLDGGSGDDTITDEAFLETPAAGAVPDMLTGGEGADSFFINLVNQTVFEGEEQLVEGDLGILSQITDFDPDEDMLMIDINNADEAGINDPVRTLDSFTLVEADDGSYTDVQLVINSAGVSGQLTATIRLDGATGLTSDDIAFADRAIV
jgi:Ca2+-binding RTX toxin-like protein